MPHEDFPKIAKQRTGRELARIQEGLEPADCKPMPSIGLGASEIRARKRYRAMLNERKL